MNAIRESLRRPELSSLADLETVQQEVKAKVEL